jgi:hypothetical protein
MAIGANDPAAPARPGDSQVGAGRRPAQSLAQVLDAVLLVAVRGCLVVQQVDDQHLAGDGGPVTTRAPGTDDQSLRGGKEERETEECTRRGHHRSGD